MQLKFSKHPVISFLCGLLLSGSILSAIYTFYLLITSDLGGGETISEEESKRTGLLILSIFLTIIAAIQIRTYRKNGKKFAANGIAVPSLIVFVFVIVYFINNLNFRTEFDKSVWDESKLKPFNMAATMVKEKSLIGLSLLEVTTKLGEGFEKSGDSLSKGESILYLVKGQWILTVVLKQNKVIESELRQPWLGV